MARRIAEHRALRPGSFEVIEVGPDPAWVTQLPVDAVLLVECLGTLIGTIVAQEVTAETEASAMNERIVQRRANALVGALCARTGDTVVVTNETGWGVVPPSPAGRVFRDVMGRANRALVGRADAAYLALAGRFVDLKDLPTDVVWPAADHGEDA
jgi:adenosylcobinamide kinase/adenosylcobinamide-phosphate guanylyltransferase